jgi:hypothetical protein
MARRTAATSSSPRSICSARWIFSSEPLKNRKFR